MGIDIREMPGFLNSASALFGTAAITGTAENADSFHAAANLNFAGAAKRALVSVAPKHPPRSYFCP